MASRAFFPIQSPQRGLVEIAGSFATKNGNGAISSVVGSGFTVDAKAATGTYVITVSDTYPELQAALATLQLNTADDWVCQIVSYVASTRKLTLKVVDCTTGNAADVADHANNRVNFSLFFKNVS